MAGLTKIVPQTTTTVMSMAGAPSQPEKIYLGLEQRSIISAFGSGGIWGRAPIGATAKEAGDGAFNPCLRRCGSQSPPQACFIAVLPCQTATPNSLVQVPSKREAVHSFLRSAIAYRRPSPAGEPHNDAAFGQDG
jgi:hypothetical protein